MFTLLQMTDIAPALFRARKSFEIEAPPGGGKTEWSAQMVIRMSQLTGITWGFTSTLIPNMNPNQMMGFMIPEQRGIHKVSTYTLPEWYQTRDPYTFELNGKLASDYEFGLCVLEEYGGGEPDVKKGAAQLFLKGQLGSTALPKGWTVMACSNRASDRSGVTKDFDHMINRRGKIPILPDVHGWEMWAVRTGIHPVIIAFAVRYPQIVFMSDVPEKQGPWCTPRSLCNLEAILKEMIDEHGNLPTDSIATGLATAWIGTAAAAQLISFIKLGQDMPSYQEIVSNPGTAKVPDKADSMMLICYNLAARVTEKDIGPVANYMERLPKEFAMTFVKAAVRRDSDLINTQRMGEWCISNASLLSAIQNVRAMESPKLKQ